VRVLFLDIDGVLNHPGTYGEREPGRIPVAPVKRAAQRGSDGEVVGEGVSISSVHPECSASQHASHTVNTAPPSALLRMTPQRLHG